MSVRKHLRLVFVLVLLTPLSAPARAQDADKPAQADPVPYRSAGPPIPLKVQVVISRFQGEKKVSSMPYTLLVNANDGTFDAFGNYTPRGGFTRLRSGAELPLPVPGPASLPTPKDTSGQASAAPIQYRAIGTNIDCWAYSGDDGRFRVSMSIEDA